MGSNASKSSDPVQCDLGDTALLGVRVWCLIFKRSMTCGYADARQHSRKRACCSSCSRVGHCMIAGSTPCCLASCGRCSSSWPHNKIVDVAMVLTNGRYMQPPEQRGQRAYVCMPLSSGRWRKGTAATRQLRLLLLRSGQDSAPCTPVRKGNSVSCFIVAIHRFRGTFTARPVDGTMVLRPPHDPITLTPCSKRHASISQDGQRNHPM